MTGHVIAHKGRGWNPRVSDWQSVERADGGQTGMTAKIAATDLKANPDVLQTAAQWIAVDEKSGEVIGAGRLKQPAANAGVVDLSSEGPAGLADTEVDRYLLQSRSYGDWVAADSDPHGYTVSKKIEMNVGKGRIHWHPAPDEVFRGGEQSGALFWAYDCPLRWIAFTLYKSEDDTAWEMVLYGANTENSGVGANLNEITSWGMGTGTTSGQEIEYALENTYDLLRLAVRRKVGSTKASGPGTVAVTTTVTGGGGSNEQQKITVSAATGGTFTLTFNGETTKPIAYNASAATVQTRLGELANLHNKAGTIDVSCSGGPLNTSPVTVTFVQDKANTNVSKLEFDYSDRLGANTAQPKFWVKDLRVNAVAGADDDFTASDVVRDICARIGVSDERVMESAINILPQDFRNASYAEILDHMALMTGWRWRFYREGLRTVCDFGPYDRTVWVFDESWGVKDLLPEQRYSRVVVQHRWVDGSVADQVEAIADPNPLGEIITAPPIALERPSSQEIAKHIAERLANDLVQERWTGNVTVGKVRDSNGTLVSHRKVKAGDTLYVPDMNAFLPIDELSRDDALSVLTFSVGIPLLDRINARRARRLALGGAA